MLETECVMPLFEEKEIDKMYIDRDIQVICICFAGIVNATLDFDSWTFTLICIVQIAGLHLICERSYLTI